MKKTKIIVTGLLLAAFVAAPFSVFAAENSTAEKEPAKTTEKAKAKAYPLNTCIVTGEKLGGDMGEPYAFTYKGREYKLCCKDCKKDFDKNPAKFVKKLEAAEKKAAESKQAK